MTVITIDKTHGLIMAAVGNVIKYVGVCITHLIVLHLVVMCLSCDYRLYDQQLEVVQISRGHTDSQSILHVPELNLVRNSIILRLNTSGFAVFFCWLEQLTMRIWKAYQPRHNHEAF